MKHTDPLFKRKQEAIDFYQTCRFLENKVIQNLKPDFSCWLNTTYGCSVKIVPVFPQGYFLAHISSFGLDMDVTVTLKNIGFDTPCCTFGDLAAGKLGMIPHTAVLKFKNEHRREILKWLETKEYHNFLVNQNPFEKNIVAASRGKGGAA